MAAADSPRLLKANAARKLTAGSFNYDDIRQQCDDYMERVKQQAQQLMDETRREAEELRRQAFNAAYQEGLQAGTAEAERVLAARVNELADQKSSQQLRTALPALEAAAAALQVERDHWLSSWESAAVRLSVAIAEKILRHELRQRPEVLPAIISETLQLAAGNPHIKIRMHPEDIADLRVCGQEVLQRLAPLGEAALTPDNQMTRGGCLIETRHGVIDARLETQLKRIMDELLEGE